MASTTTKRLIGCAIAVLMLFGLGTLLLIVATAFSGKRFGVPDFTPGVAVIDVFGVLGENDRVMEQLDSFENDENVRALVLHIDSPGGPVAPVQRMVRRIEALKEEHGWPVVAAFESVAASGGYYLACTADSILALPGSLTGSIGAVMSFPEFSALLTRLGIEYQVVTAGKYKDFGGIHRPLTDEERRWIQGVLEGVLDQFVDAIARGRPLMERDEIRGLADGRIFSGEMAVDLGLVDRLGSLEDAVQVAGDLAELRGEPRLIRRPRKRTVWDRLFEERLGGLSELARATPNSSPQLEYRWR